MRTLTHQEHQSIQDTQGYDTTSGFRTIREVESVGVQQQGNGYTLSAYVRDTDTHEPLKGEYYHTEQDALDALQKHNARVKAMIVEDVNGVPSNQEVEQSIRNEASRQLDDLAAERSKTTTSSPYASYE